MRHPKNGKKMTYHIKTKNSKVSGKIYFKNPGGNGLQFPAKNIECGIRIKVKKTFLETFYTDSNGNFSVTVPLHETEDLVIEMRTSTKGDHPINLYKDNTLAVHKLVSGAAHVKYGENFDGWEICINNIADNSLFLKSMILIAAGKLAYSYMERYVNLEKSLVIYYPAKSYKGSQEAGKFIHINPDDDSELIETFMHEFGHFVAYCLKFINPTFGKHYLSTNRAAERNNKLNGLHFAWNEGFAEFYSGYVINKHPAFKVYFGLTESTYMKEPDDSLSGESNELSVQRFLSLATYHPELVSTAKNPKAFLSEEELWNMLKNKCPKSIDECVKLCRQMNADRTLLGAILSKSRIAPYDLNIVDNQLQFSNAGVQDSKKSRLDQFEIHVEADGNTYQYTCKLEQLISLKNGRYGFYFEEPQIQESLKAGKTVKAYIDGYQLYGMNTGPYPSELYTVEGAAQKTAIPKKIVKPRVKKK